ncbi:MAG: chorismate synthase [Bacteroidetes bacterium]|nr:chorismate synthase [Bacteroidota bacterium]
MSNSIGRNLVFTSFGESHGPATGGILDGCPAGIKLDYDLINSDLRRRSPIGKKATTSRVEADQCEFLSGILDGVTLGTPIAYLIRNTDVKSSDYDDLKEVFRPGHADHTWAAKFGIRDHRGGGRASARETVARVVAVAIAKMLLAASNISVEAFVTSVAGITVESDPASFSGKISASNPISCPDQKIAGLMLSEVEKNHKSGDSTGGVITCVVQNVQAGIGSPVFNKLHASLAYANLSIPAAKGFELGAGFENSKLKGSELNDSLLKPNISAASLGGINGGISNGGIIWFRVAFRPAASIAMEQKAYNSEGKMVSLKIRGRHDSFFLPRAVPVVEAMTALTIADYLSY